jgi:uncharacterized protein (TIGR00661 family)
MNIIYGVCSWGLGHATRSLPIMRKLIQENNDLTIISHGRSLELLKNELGEEITYVNIPDYPILLSDNTRQFIAKSSIYWPLFLHRIQSGLRKLTKILEKNGYDTIISDARYDVYSKKVPSFFISHQMRIMNPLRIQIFETGSEFFNLFFFKRCRGVIVPDFKEDNLSGELSHELKKIDENRLHYVGVLSDFKKLDKKRDIDYLLSITGPEPQRTKFEKVLFSQLDQLKGKIVVTLGKTDNIDLLENKQANVYSYLTRKKREEVLNRSKLVISRSGYSTILDLSVLNSHALLIPTPGQIEQEYLAQYHMKKNTFYAVNQESLSLKSDVIRAKKTTGIMRRCNVNKTVESIISIISS